MAGMPTRALTLPHAATDNSETPATACGGTGLGASLNQLIDDAKGTAVKVGSGASTPAANRVLRGTGVADVDGNQQSAWGQVQAGDFAASAITGNDIANLGVITGKYAAGSIRTADLAANAVSQTAEVQGVTNNPTSSSTGKADVPDMSVTLTTTGGDVLVWFEVSFAHSSAVATVEIAIRRDTSSDDAPRSLTVSNANHTRVLSTFKRYSGLAAGTYTFKGRASNDVGATLTFSGISRGMLAEELKR